MNWEDSAADSAHEPRFPVSRHWLTSQIQVRALGGLLQWERENERLT